MMQQRRPKVRYKIPPPPKEKLVELYCKKRLCYVDVAKALNVSHFMVGEWIKLYGIEPRRGNKEPRRIDVTGERVAGMYAEGKSTHKIARELSCSHTLVWKRLREAGVPLRDRGSK